MSYHENKHAVVLPFPFSSHPGLLAKLVRRLAAAAPKIHFSFINTTKSNAVVFPSHDSKHDLPNNIRIYGIDAPSGRNVPEEAELFFNIARSSYESVIQTAVAEIGLPASFLLTDVMTPSASEIAIKMGVDWIAVWVGAPYGLLTHIYTDTIIDQLRLLRSQEEDDDLKMVKKKKIDFAPGLSMMQVGDLPGQLLKFDKRNNNMSVVQRLLAKVDSVLPNAKAIVLNCFEEGNLTEAAAALRSKVQTLVLQIGCPEISFTQLQRSDSDRSGCMLWLDRQNCKSVVYVGFGTMLLLSPEEISAIAEALEESKTTPYLWSLKDQLKIHLPPGFEDRTNTYGKLVPWAPQTLVLSHPSVGAHLTHAGFNSMVESIMEEVPMICRPLWADNMMNARMVEDVWRIGVGFDGGIITKNELVQCLEMVLGDGEEGKMMREKIKALKEVVIESTTANGSATRDFNSLVELIFK